VSQTGNADARRALAEWPQQHWLWNILRRTHRELVGKRARELAVRESLIDLDVLVLLQRIGNTEPDARIVEARRRVLRSVAIKRNRRPDLDAFDKHRALAGMQRTLQR